ncbi:LysR family transcriptional regulator [Rhodobacteraceae bacterium CCMM004]|nr:LysR family transcriptional regulator [Rhodobacteraceae bacterium CCMM004]
MKDMAWDDLALFAAVGRSGALAPAAETTGTSSATLSRRMTALEAQMGRRLFLRGRGGYGLTADGRALLARVARMEAAAADVAEWRRAGDGPVRVRISAGTWTALDLAQNLAAFWSAEAGWTPEFVFCNMEMDIARREIDIGVRNARPTRPWLAGRRTGCVAYALYARDPEVAGYVAVSGDNGQTPSARWLRAHHAARVVTTANDPRLALELARAGVGRIVLPCFAGDGATGLMRLGPPIAELTSEEWLVAHHEGRHEPAVRMALDALAGYLRARTVDQDGS